MTALYGKNMALSRKYYFDVIIVIELDYI